MSSDLRVQLEDLRVRINRVVDEIQDIADDFAELQVEGAFGDWVLVEDSRPPFSPTLLEPAWNHQRFYGLETGPPETPDFCVNLAVASLEGDNNQVVSRARKAFTAEFWCKLALDTHTHYNRIEGQDFGEHRFWIVLSHNSRLNRRVSTERCLQCALEVDRNSVWEGFRTFTELSIFCVGARIFLPPLEKWTSLF